MKWVGNFGYKWGISFRDTSGYALSMTMDLHFLDTSANALRTTNQHCHIEVSIRNRNISVFEFALEILRATPSV